MFSIVLQNRAKIATTLIASIFVFFLITLPRYNDTAKIAFVVLILAALFYLIVNLKEVKSTSTIERAFLAAIIVNFLWIAISFYANGEPGRGSSVLWGRHFYLLFAVPLFFLFRKVEIPDKAVFLTLFLSVLVSLIDILVDLGQGIDHRVQGLNPNAFGPIQLCLSGILFFYFLRKYRNWQRWFALTGFVFGIATVVFSGSRNTWMTLVILCIFFAFYFTRSQSVWKRFGLAFGIMLLLVSAYFTPIVESRVNLSIDSLSNYFASDDYKDISRKSALGVRIELWKTGWYIFLENPILGVGVGGFKVEAKKNSERYQVNDDVRLFKYVHNQYLAALATRGLPGLVFYLLVMLLPVHLALSQKTAGHDSEVARLSIILICFTYLIGSLGEDHFEAKSATMFYAVMMPFWLARINSNKHRQDAKTLS